MLHGDNQQERPFEALSWLAGILEGEGCFQMTKAKYGKYTRYYPRVTLVNTDILMLDTVAQIFKSNKIGFHIHTRQRTKNCKPTMAFTIQGIKRAAKLLPLIIPHMRSKKRKAAELLYEYVQWRISQPYVNGQGFDKSRAELVYKQIGEINQVGILRDYTPVVLKLEDGDIVRTTWRHVESHPAKESWGV